MARRRVFRRWLGWIAWTIVLPVVGLAAIIAVLAGLVFWQYMGHDAAYVAAQTWVQQEFGSFESNKKPTAARTDTTSMIPLTDEATPDLQLDRNLTFKTNPTTSIQK